MPDQEPNQTHPNPKPGESKSILNGLHLDPLILIASLLLSPFFALSILNHFSRFWARSTPVQVGLLLGTTIVWAALLYPALGYLNRKTQGHNPTRLAALVLLSLLAAWGILGRYVQDFTPLPPGEKTLVITATGEKNAASSSARVKLLELTAPDGERIPLHALEPDGDWERLEAPLAALISQGEGPASLRTNFTSQWGQPVTLLAESSPDAGILKVEINDLQTLVDLYAIQPDQRLLTLSTNTSPPPWKALLYGSDLLLLSTLLLLFGTLIFFGAGGLESLFQRQPRKTGLSALILVLLTFLVSFAFFLPDAWQKANGQAALQAGMLLWDRWELVFLLNATLVATGLGVLLLKWGEILPLPPLARFLAGLCLMPVVIGLWMLGCAALLPGAPAPVFLFLPSAAALIFSLLNYRLFGQVWQDLAAGLSNESNKPALALAWLCLAVVLAQATATLLVNSRSLTLQNDTNVYRAMARPFAEARSLEGIPAFDGRSHPNLPQDTHNYLFQSYLAYAMLHTNPDEIGFPHDKPVNDAYQILFFSMLLALTALVWTTRRALAVPLAMLILLQVSQLGIIGYIFSRDAYRIIPLLLLTIVLGSLRMDQAPQRKDIFTMALLALLSFYCLSGHTLGGILCVLICLAWLLWQILLYKRLQFLNLLFVGLAISLGLLFGSQKYIRGYLAFGTVNVNIPEIVTQGTNYPEIIVQIRETRYNEIFNSFGFGNPLLTTALVVLERDRYLVLLPGMLVSLLVIVLWRRKLACPIPVQLLFWSLASLAIFFPFIGFLDVGKIILSKAFVGNLRYSLHFYPFFSAILAVAILQLEKSSWVQRGEKEKRLFCTTVSVIVLALFVSCMSAFSRYDDNFWRINNIPGNQLEYSLSIVPVRQMQEEIAPRNVLQDKAMSAYHLDNNALFLYTLAGREIITSSTILEVEKNLQKANVGAVVIRKSDIEGGMQNTVLYDYLHRSGETKIVFENEVLYIFLLPAQHE